MKGFYGVAAAVAAAAVLVAPEKAVKVAEAEYVSVLSSPELAELAEKHRVAFYESGCEAVESGVRMRVVKRVVFLSAGGVPGKVIEKSEKCWLS